MPGMEPAAEKPVRRTQEQRSAETRGRLLDATIDCLVEFGYAGTTTPRVAARAGVTRGAQVHHFPAKTDLVIAAIKHLAAKRSERLAREIKPARAGITPAEQVLELVWEVHQGPLYLATVELWVAARTDVVLAAEMAKVEPDVTNAFLLAVAPVLPEEWQGREFTDFVYTAMDTIRGILLANLIADDPGRARRRWNRAVRNLGLDGPRSVVGPS